MKNRFGLTSRSLLFAVLVHLVLLAMIGLSFTWKTKTIKPGLVKPIQAQAVPEMQIQQQMAELERQEQQKLAEEQAAQQKLEELEQKRVQEEEQRQLEEQKRVEAEAQRKLEEQKKAETEKLRLEEEKKRVAAEKKRKEEEEKQRQEQAEKEQMEKEKKQKEEAERKKKEEAEQKKREETERKKKEEAERKRKAEEEDRRQAQEALQAKILQDEALRALGQFDWRIRETIERNWSRPASSQSGLTAKILIQVTANGDVRGARVTQSSGDPYFDRSAENAVWKASPLPLPADPRYRDIYQKESIQINFKPDS